MRGQVQVASTDGQVTEVHLEPADPPACVEAIAAIHDADWVVLGPGSWFTSVIPHLLVPELRRALVGSTARKVVTLNLEPQAGETDGFSPETHLEVLAEHAPDLRLDVVLADQGSVVDHDQLEAVARLAGRPSRGRRPRRRRRHPASRSCQAGRCLCGLSRSRHRVAAVLAAQPV